MKANKPIRIYKLSYIEDVWCSGEEARGQRAEEKGEGAAVSSFQSSHNWSSDSSLLL